MYRGNIGRHKGMQQGKVYCDALAARNRNEVDMQTFKSAIGGYFNSPGKDLPKLSEYARALGVEEDLQRCAEVML